MRKKIILAGFLIVALLFAGAAGAEATRVTKNCRSTRQQFGEQMSGLVGSTRKSMRPTLVRRPQNGSSLKLDLLGFD